MSARELQEDVVAFTLSDGRRAAAILPVVPEGAPYRIREGIARRRIAATTGHCPCGASVDYAAATGGGVHVAEVLHERTCPADTARLVKAFRRWTR